MKGKGLRLRISLLWRFLVLVLTVSLIPMGALGFLLHQRIQNDLEMMAQKEMSLRLDQAADSISALLQQDEMVLRSAAAFPGITDMKKEDQEAILLHLRQANPDFASVVVIGADGQDVARTGYAVPRSYSDQSYFQQVIKGADRAFQVVSDKASGKRVLAIAVPIKRGDTVIGALVATVGLDQVGAFLTQLQIGNTGSAWMVDDQDKLMVHQDTQKVQAQTNMAKHPAVLHGRSGADGTVSFAEDGRNWLAVAKALPQGWVLVVQMDQKEVLAELFSFQFEFPLVAAGLVLVLLLLTWLASRSLTRPIKAMAQFANSLADGDLTAPLTLKRSDELGDMADALRYMQNGLRVHVKAVQESASRVASTAGDLGVATAVAAHSREVILTAFDRTRDEVEQLTGQQRERLEDTKSVVGQLVGAIEQVASAAANQAVEVSHAASVVADVAQQVDVVVNGMSRVADAAVQVESSAGSVRKTIAGALDGMGTTQASVDLGAEAIRQMGVRASALVTFLHDIGSVATQTNLLAIEAARGGSSTALAADVQRLADRSADLARKSADLLVAMQEGVSQAINLITEGESTVRRGVDQVKAAEWAMADIQRASRTTLEEGRTIRAAAGGLQEAQKRLSQAMETLAALAEENSASAEEMAAGSETVRTQVEALDTLALQNFESIQSVAPEMQSIARSMERVVQMAGRLQEIKDELEESTANLRT